jgi:hypothetical protein
VTDPPTRSPVRPKRFLAAGLAAVVVAGSAAIALSGDDSGAPAKSNAAPSTPIIFSERPF